MEKLNLQFVLNIIYLTANKMMKKTILILCVADQCQWFGNTSAKYKDSTIQKPKQQWRGYKILESSDVIETPLFDQNLILDRPRRSAAAGGAATTDRSNKNKSRKPCNHKKFQRSAESPRLSWN